MMEDWVFGLVRIIKLKKIKTEGDGSIGQTWTALRRFWSKTKQGPISTEGTLMGASAKGMIIPELKELFYNTMENGEKFGHHFQKQLKIFLKKNFLLKNLNMLQMKKLISISALLCNQVST